MLVFELKRELSARNLDSSGRKVFLVSRLQFALDEERRMAENQSNVIANETNQSNLIASDPIDMQILPSNESALVIQSHEIESSSDNDPIDSNSETFENNEIETSEATQTEPKETENSENNGLVSPHDDTFENNQIASSVPTQTEAHSIGNTNDIAEIETAECDKSDVAETPLTVEKMPGKRKGSEIYYCPSESQFYLKKRKLAKGKISAVCRYATCNKRIHIDEATGIATCDGPNVPHDHSPKKNEYAKIKLVNRMKQECANVDVVGTNDRKTSVIKSIFNAEVEK